jgi:hypothetical protein
VDDTKFDVLNAVYLRKIASAGVVVECTGLPVDQAAPALAELAEAGQLDDLGGQFMLTEVGTTAVLQAYTDRYSGLRGVGAVEDWYQRFETLNSQFLQTISAWQTSGQDEALLDKLLKIITRQIRALGSITGTVPRYARYAERFGHALELVEVGKSEYITNPHMDSLHNIWFEFHEDILTLLGRPRLDAESDH